MSFVEVGDRVKFIPSKIKYRSDNWPKEVWLGDEFIEGTVIAYHPSLPELRGINEEGKEEIIESIPAWAHVQWDNGADTTIDSGNKGECWDFIGNQGGKRKRND